ncbi:MAG: hypothetical protein ABIH71_00050 [Candidatus Omnitrophota bacterium]
MSTGKRQYYSYFGVGASFGARIGGSFLNSWSEYSITSYNLTEQSFHGYVILKSASAKAGGGVGGFIMDWASGPAKNERALGVGFETGFSLGTSANHGVMWRR